MGRGAWSGEWEVKWRADASAVVERTAPRFIVRLFCIKKPANSDQAAPAAHVNFRLLLLPSDPDKIHGMTPHGTQSSSLADPYIITRSGKKYKADGGGNEYLQLVGAAIQTMRQKGIDSAMGTISDIAKAKTRGSRKL